MSGWMTDRRLAILLLVIMAMVAGAVGFAESNEADAPPLLTTSLQDDGGRILFRWLNEIGYNASNETLGSYEIPAATELVLIIEPTERIRRDEWDTIDAWIADGGTLVLLGTSGVSSEAFTHFDFSTSFSFRDAALSEWHVPLFQSPSTSLPPELEVRTTLVTERSNFVTHVSADGEPALVSFEVGAGRVVLGTIIEPFTNAGLRTPSNPSFVLNIVSLVPSGANIWIDDWHHGVRLSEAYADLRIGPGDWLRYTPGGRSFAYIAAILLVVVLLSGWRFGRPVPLANQLRRRAPLEYVTAIANLNRRAGYRFAVQKRYRVHLKRELGKRYRLSPVLPDDQFVLELENYNPTLEGQELAQLLSTLRQTNLSESQFLGAVTQVNTWLEQT